MSRYGPEHKQETRTKVLEAAGRAMREEGMAGVTIPGIMARVGLTQGGFYAHFENKEALIAEASAQTLTTAIERMLGRGRNLPPERGLAAIVDHYLSEEHRDNIASGCPLPAMSCEVTRTTEGVRGAYTEAVRGLFAGLTPYVAGSSPKTVEDPEIGLAAAMVGGLLLSRAVNDPELSAKILNATRQVCLHLGQSAPHDGEQE